MLTLRPITNRAADGRFALPADGWWHLVPVGEFPHRESGLTQVLDKEAIREIADRFEPGVLVDFDHFSYDPGHPSEAAGWIEEVQVRPDGLWARARWTDVGSAALANGRYRFVSPTWLPSDVAKLGGNRIRPLRLDSAGLTNQPNLRGMAPLTNRFAVADDVAAVKPTDTPKTEEPTMKSVAAQLGLSQDAAEQAVLNEVTKLQGRAKAAEDQLPALKNRVAELETQVESTRTAQADADLARYKDRLPEATHEHWRQQLMANRAAAIATLDTLPEPTSSPTGASRAPALKNRGTKPADADQATAATEFNGKVAAYRNANRCSHQEAWDAVAASNPDLLARATSVAA